MVSSSKMACLSANYDLSRKDMTGADWYHEQGVQFDIYVSPKSSRAQQLEAWPRAIYAATQAYWLLEYDRQGFTLIEWLVYLRREAEGIAGRYIPTITVKPRAWRMDGIASALRDIEMDDPSRAVASESTPEEQPRTKRHKSSDDEASDNSSSSSSSSPRSRRPRARRSDRFKAAPPRHEPELDVLALCMQKLATSSDDADMSESSSDADPRAELPRRDLTFKFKPYAAPSEDDSDDAPAPYSPWDPYTGLRIRTSGRNVPPGQRARRPRTVDFPY